MDSNKKRYLLIDEKGFPIIPVAKYLKYIDNCGRSHNTQKTYCYALKAYVEYLRLINLDYKFVTLNVLIDFIEYLRNPYENNKIVSFKLTTSKRTEKTVNLITTVITNFYDYLYRTEECNNNLIEKVM